MAFGDPRATARVPGWERRLKQPRWRPKTWGLLGTDRGKTERWHDNAGSLRLRA